MGAKSTISLHACEAERQELLRLNGDCGVSWPNIARLPRYKGIPFTSLYMWAIGERPLADRHLDKLGIPHEKPAPVCTNPACEGYGEPHVYDCRTQTVKAKREPRVKKQRDKYDRYYAWMFEETPAKDWR